MANLGHILDLRDKSDCPSFQNYIRKDTETLKQLCISALENQLKELTEYHAKLFREQNANAVDNGNYGNEYKDLHHQLTVQLSNVSSCILTLLM